MTNPSSQRVWTVAEAKARLSEILRLAETEGPQRIGKRSSFVVVPERIWQEHAPPDRMPMGQGGSLRTCRAEPISKSLTAAATPVARFRLQIGMTTTGTMNDRISARHERSVGDDPESPQSPGRCLFGSNVRIVVGVPGSSRTGVRAASIAAGTASGSVENGPVTFPRELRGPYPAD